MGFFGHRNTSWRQKAKFDLRSIFSDRKSSNSNMWFEGLSDVMIVCLSASFSVFSLPNRLVYFGKCTEVIYYNTEQFGLKIL